MDVDYTLETLLDLDGEVIYQELGYWILIEARAVSSNDRVPHGIKYSLTLHDMQGKRVLGMDNAHPIKKATAFGKAPEYSDHIHTANGNIIPYNFINAGKLLEDFFDLADAFMKEMH
ncbi:toxin-antitoxin system TumE family protein [Pseudidiomarina sp. E22-M8]|uniref:toxin-antitoxin system TumE family protein n=1 Tax=Pseudidiomarina sp. E22-M8 TaxID=3424768 RepID=UPI00403D4837